MDSGAQIPAPPRRLPRGELLSLLRQRCTSLVDDEHSLCEVASRLKLACGGFSQWKFHELKERYDWIAQRRPGLTRAELEDLANRWQIARQTVNETPLACDSQMLETKHKICEGWDHFTDQDLMKLWHELSGETVEVVPEAPAAGR